MGRNRTENDYNVDRDKQVRHKQVLRKFSAGVTEGMGVFSLGDALGVCKVCGTVISGNGLATPSWLGHTLGGAYGYIPVCVCTIRYTLVGGGFFLTYFSGVLF